MSRTSICTKNQNLLWAISGGRCEYEGCNKVLYMDILTKRKYNSAYIAHIVADAPDGPRGDLKRSMELSDNIDNLMLLCDEHHRLIDIVDVAELTEARLLKMKKKHEDRIKLLTSISPDLSSEIILYGANIGAQNSPLSYHTACETLVPDFYPANDAAIELGMKNSALLDHNETYWSAEIENLSRQFNQKVKPLLMHGESRHFSVFALAPQPLLVKLGALLNDLNDLKIYQKHREPSTWKWQQGTSNNTYFLREPVNKCQTPALVFSLSANITNDRIKSVLGEDVSIWEVTMETPNNDFLKTERLLSEFREITRLALNKVKSYHGCVKLHIFPAMPVSAAIELGRVWMPKADMPLVIYDQNRINHGFFKAITIN